MKNYKLLQAAFDKLYIDKVEVSEFLSLTECNLKCQQEAVLSSLPARINKIVVFFSIWSLVSGAL